MDHNDSTLTEFDKMVLSEYPYPIAVGYRRVLDAKDARSRVERALAVFDLGIRTLALGLIQQYSLRDAATINFEELNNLIVVNFPKPSLGIWKNIVFAALRAYKEHRDLLFMKELHQLYWDTNDKERRKIEEPYNKLVEIRNDIAHIRNVLLKEPDWPSFSEEVVPNLIEVLQHFKFLRHYDLAHITARVGAEYDYVQYTGERPSPSTTPIITDQELHVGWLYLTKNQTQFAPLHPLLVFYEPDEGEASAGGLGLAGVLIGALSDTALYNTFTKKKITYVAPVLGEVITDNSPLVLDELVRRLHDNIVQLIKLQQIAKKLTWTLLADVAKKVSDERFGDVRSKYIKELYLQRQPIKIAFQEFLYDGKTKAFLLLGKSGVGKSSFFLSMADEYAEDKGIALLLYNGARLWSDEPLDRIIANDIASYLRLEELEDAEISDLLLLISRIPDIDKRRLVLFVDAINENSDAKALLRRIDDLVSASVKYPWLKVVISSRPEAWKTIRRGTSLVEHLYYTRSGDREMGVEIQPFSIGSEVESIAGPTALPAREPEDIGVVVRDFTRVELPLAYEKYKNVYDLRTDYSEITSDLRRILNDPLTLKLVAKTYSGTRLPSTFRPGEIYSLYVDQLIKDERLEIADVKFLEDEVMRLMLAEDHYENKITVDEIDSATTSSGSPLSDFITNSDKMSNQRHMNQSFQSLANAEILVMRGSALDYEIGFKYERFYDYYGGKRIFQLASKSGVDRYTFFLDMIRMTGKQAAPAQSTSQR